MGLGCPGQTPVVLLTTGSPFFIHCGVAFLRSDVGQSSFQKVESVFDSLDYRAFLRDWLEARREQDKKCSLRWFAHRLQMDPGFLANILQGRKHLPETAIPAVIRTLRFTDQEAEYFRRLVAFNRARSEAEIAETFARLSEVRDLGIERLDDKRYKYWMEWRYAAIRVNLLAQEFRGDYAELARRIEPPLTEEQAREAVEVLLELGLARWNERGVLEPVHTFVAPQDGWSREAVRRFQDQTLELARRSLREHPPWAREVSTVTLAIAKERMPELQALVRDFRNRLLHWAADLPDADSVVQVNVAAFPLSREP